jgi:hypothetical protein
MQMRPADRWRRGKRQVFQDPIVPGLDRDGLPNSQIQIILCDRSRQNQEPGITASHGGIQKSPALCSPSPSMQGHWAVCLRAGADTGRLADTLVFHGPGEGKWLEHRSDASRLTPKLLATGGVPFCMSGCCWILQVLQGVVHHVPIGPISGNADTLLVFGTDCGTWPCLLPCRRLASFSR